jgi:uncharacterized LabA/DUF88 family protein
VQILRHSGAGASTLGYTQGSTLTTPYRVSLQRPAGDRRGRHQRRHTKLPENKVALFIDFDNIRIGIRQHFGGELHPQKLMNKASKYGRVTTAKAYADFTGHPKEFQDKLLFAAGIEPIHAPSKISGGRRQSSADMHMVIDMFLEAIDHEDVDTFILMTGDADFVRMVATLRRRFGRKVIISGVQSTSTSLDLMNAGDARDPITKADVDMTGELGRMTRPLVTRADLDAQAAADEAGKPQKGIGGIFGGIFRKRVPAATPAPAPGTVATPRIPAAPSAPRRMRATEVRGGTSIRPTASPSSSTRGRSATPPAAPGRRSPAGAETVSRGRGRVQELPAAGPGTKPDDFETKLVREIYAMPPGRSGYTTIKTIEETLRSKAGQLGGTRKEVPMRLERLGAMGLFKRETRPRGNGQVEVGELVMDHPLMPSLTEGVARTEVRPPRLPRQPRPASPGREVAVAQHQTPAESATAAEAEAPEAETVAAEDPGTEAAQAGPDEEAAVAVAEPEEPAPAGAIEAPAPTGAIEEAPASAAAEAAPFRWVTSTGAQDQTRRETAAGSLEAVGEAQGPTEKAPAKAAKPRAKRAPRKTPAKSTRTSSRSKKAAAATGAEREAAPEAEADVPPTSPDTSPAAETIEDQTVPV